LGPEGDFGFSSFFNREFLELFYSSTIIGFKLLFIDYANLPFFGIGFDSNWTVFLISTFLTIGLLFGIILKE
jgi:hypothetical protein